MTVKEYHAYNFLGEFSPGILSMTQENRNKLRGSRPVTSTSRRMQEVSVESLEDSVNWVDRGAVTPVKNQGMCGACKYRLPLAHIAIN